MSTEIAKQNEQQLAIESQKREAWGRMGVIIFRQELQLQVSAQASLSKLENLPTTIEDVPAAEMALKEVKADCAKLTEERKKITAQFDAVAARLMQPEKSFQTPITDFANAIIKVKKDYQNEQAKIQLKAAELNRIKQNLLISVSNLDAQFKSLITQKVNEAYTFALTKGFPPDEIDDYKDRVAFRITERMFIAERPSPSSQYATKEEVETIIAELFKITPADYVAMFGIDLEKRFEDYTIAFNNKKEALAIAAREQEEKLQEIQDEGQNAAISATLECTSTELSVEPEGFKALKKAYEIDMPETFENAMKILSAFMANKQKAFEKTTVKKWFGFNADSAGKALAKLKSEDNSFAPVGIIFKEVDKL